MRDAFSLEQINDLGVGYKDLGLEVIEGRRMKEENEGSMWGKEWCTVEGERKPFVSYL